MDSVKPEGSHDPGASGATLSEPTAGPPQNLKNTTFEFKHKVFQATGAVFRKDRTSGTVALHLMLGGVAASISMSQLTSTFAIAKESPDGQTLQMVDKGLNFVREIRPGDSIPNELLDGSASWAMDRRHYDRARSRILVQLVKWMTDGNSSIDPGVDVLALIETPEVRGKITSAFGAAAEQLGLQGGDAGLVPAMIAHLTGELAQIEALREKVAGYAVIQKRLKELTGPYRNDTRTSDTLKRISTLLSGPLAALRRQFHMVEAHTAEIMSSLRQLTATVQFLRSVRDELRAFILLWDDLDAAWLELRVERSMEADALITRTYRFAATHYLVTQSWAGGAS